MAVEGLYFDFQDFSWQSWSGFWAEVVIHFAEFLAAAAILTAAAAKSAAPAPRSEPDAC